MDDVKLPDEQYIGDGVYVSFDGYQFVLKANSHKNPTDVIYLDPSVVQAFEEYRQYVKGFFEGQPKEES